MKKIFKYLIIIFIVVFLIVGFTYEEKGANNYLSGKHNIEIKMKDYGSMYLELDADTAPITVTNFINLVNDKFYDGLTFHRVIDGFMIQGGDPEKNGSGGSDKTIKGEFSSNGVNNNIKHVRGVISMARSNHPDSASSQFFIMHKDYPALDGDYAAFGKVTKGIEIVDEIVKDYYNEEYSNGMLPLDNQPTIEYIKVIEK